MSMEPSGVGSKLWLVEAANKTSLEEGHRKSLAASTRVSNSEFDPATSSPSIGGVVVLPVRGKDEMGHVGVMV